MTNPLKLEEIQSLVNVATGVVLPENVAECLLACKRKGQGQMTKFIDERLNTNEVSFWDPIPKLKVKTLRAVCCKDQLRSCKIEKTDFLKLRQNIGLGELFLKIQVSGRIYFILFFVIFFVLHSAAARVKI